MTPAVNPISGVAYGYKRLATSQEWEDAGDGVIGPGGSDWPWGDEADDSRCVLSRDEADPEFNYLQPTGSQSRCVSAWGVYDQIGNAWEWTDSQVSISIATWSAATSGLRIDGDVVRVDDAAALDGLWLAVADVTGTAAIGDAGELAFAADSDSWTSGTREERGYLVTPAEGAPATNHLPVGVRRVSDDGKVAQLSIRVATEADGLPFPDKRGGAYSTATTVTLHDPDYSHLYCANHKPVVCNEHHHHLRVPELFCRRYAVL
jgi:hypothetical protein